MKVYHHIWLWAHPNRNAEWLQQRLNDGFHVHHIDGDKLNNQPCNLLLVDGADHMKLHGINVYRQAQRARQLYRTPKPARPRKPKQVSVELLAEYNRIMAAIS